MKNIQTEEISQKDRNARYIAEMTDDLVFDYDTASDTMRIPRHTASRLGLPEVIEKFSFSELCADVIHADDRENLCKKLKKLSEKAGSDAAECRINISGKYEWHHARMFSPESQDSRPKTVLVVFHNINAEKKLPEVNSEIKAMKDKLSSTDPLTGLYNRASFKRHAARMIASMGENDVLAIVYTDINNFAYINEHFGYKEGDRALKRFASMIKPNSEENERIACRIYSDYFITINKRASADSTVEAVKRINKAFCSYKNERYPDMELNLATGIYFIKSKDEDITVAMDNANLARRKAKTMGIEGVYVYTPELGLKRSREQSAVREFHSAIADGSIEMFLQPKFSLKTRSIIGSEALARWKNSDGTYRMPCEFIDVLEKMGYIVRLDFYMLEQALKILARWKREGRRLYPISVNFSRVDIDEKDFTDKICYLTDMYCVDRSYIEIEVTESAFADERLMDILVQLKQRGFKIDLDDFGIGYSSLGFLYEAAIDIVKVDKAFLKGIETDEDKFNYVCHVCQLISSSGAEILFEGIETEAQASKLAKIDIDRGQGWLFSKAVKTEEFERTYLS